MSTVDRKHRQYHCQATLADGSTNVLYAWADSPARALAIAHATWRDFGVQPIWVVLRYYFRERMGSKPVIEWSLDDQIPDDLL
jgi:hypothetical protein